MSVVSNTWAHLENIGEELALLNTAQLESFAKENDLNFKIAVLFVFTQEEFNRTELCFHFRTTQPTGSKIELTSIDRVFEIFKSFILVNLNQPRDFLMQKRLEAQPSLRAWQLVASKAMKNKRKSPLISPRALPKKYNTEMVEVKA